MTVEDGPTTVVSLTESRESSAGVRRSRPIPVAMLADYEARGPTRTGRATWTTFAMTADRVETLSRMTARERDLFGFPRPGDPDRNHLTLEDVAVPESSDPGGRRGTGII